VEHGITELITDLDLVAEQLWIAAGAPLSEDVLRAAAAAMDPTRHAMEVRLAAEDPARAFAPSPGRVGRWAMPSGPGVRVDTAVRAGDRIPPDYDPMIAKIMTVGADRSAALDRMRRALDEVEVTGIQTTLPFDRALVRDEAFRTAEDLSTEWVDRHWDGAADRATACRKAAVVAAGAGVPDTGDGSPPAADQDHRPGAPSLYKDTAPSSRWRDAGRASATDRWPR
jgi:acetyl/propionyl-CoA carboxylase alpha subunit